MSLSAHQIVIEKMILMLQQNSAVTAYVPASNMYLGHIASIQDAKFPAISFHLMPAPGKSPSDGGFMRMNVQMDLWFQGRGANAYTWDDLFTCYQACVDTLHRNGGMERALTPPNFVSAVDSPSGGHLISQQYYYYIACAVDPVSYKVSTPCQEISVWTSGASNLDQVTLTFKSFWGGPYGGLIGMNFYRSTVSGSYPAPCCVAQMISTSNPTAPFVDHGSLVYPGGPPADYRIAKIVEITNVQEGPQMWEEDTHLMHWPSRFRVFANYEDYTFAGGN